MFRQMYEASPKNISGMFRVGSARWNSSADAAMHMAEGDLAATLTGEDGTKDSLEPATLALSTDQLARTTRATPPACSTSSKRRGIHARAEKGE